MKLNERVMNETFIRGEEVMDFLNREGLTDYAQTVEELIGWLVLQNDEVVELENEVHDLHCDAAGESI